MNLKWMKSLRFWQQLSMKNFWDVMQYNVWNRYQHVILKVRQYVSLKCVFMAIYYNILFDVEVFINCVFLWYINCEVKLACLLSHVWLNRWKNTLNYSQLSIYKTAWYRFPEHRNLVLKWLPSGLLYLVGLQACSDISEEHEISPPPSKPNL